jgi:hypothetical protein
MFVAELLYCWRCKMEIPMLDDDEWVEVVSHFTDGRDVKGLARYYQITGFRETNPAAIGHHRLSLFGPPCPSCGKPLRTPRAKWCAACGAPREEE